MREKDIETLPGKKMSDMTFLCMASLTGSGLDQLFWKEGRRPIIDYGRQNSADVRLGIVQGLRGKGWISPSPIRDGSWFATLAGRKATMEEASRRLRAVSGVLGFPCSPDDTFYYGVTYTGLECLWLVERRILDRKAGTTLRERGHAMLAGTDMLSPETMIAGRPAYVRFEDHYKEHYDPEGHAADVAAAAALEAAKTERRRIEEESHRAEDERCDAELAERLALARRRERERTERTDAVTTSREDVLRLARECFLQGAGYDDLMTAVERMLAAEDDLAAAREVEGTVPMAAA